MAFDIRIGDALTVLRAMPDASVHCVITSPPYWGLRAYGGDPDMIGLEPTLDEHLDNLVAVFREVRRVLRDDGTLWLNYADAYTSGGRATFRSSASDNKGHRVQDDMPRPDTPHGLKPKDLMGLAWRLAFALQDDSWWLRRDIIIHKSNTMPESAKDRPTTAHAYLFILTQAPRSFYDYKAIEEPVSGTAHALAALRHVTPAGRDTSTGEGAHGSLHRHGQRRGAPAKRPRATPPSHEGHDATSHRTLDDAKYDHRLRVPGVNPKSAPSGSGIRQNESYQAAMIEMRPTRQCRSVWTIATAPFKGAHFATFPPALVERPIKAGTSERGVCPDCAAPWEHIIERVDKGWDGSRYGERAVAASTSSGGTSRSTLGSSNGRLTGDYETAGWRPTCACYDGRYRAEHPEPRRARKRAQRAAWAGRWKRVRRRPGGDDWPTVPATVLDPFAGAGTVGLVAERLGRDSILIEINPDYAEMARERIEGDAPAQAATIAAAAE